MGFYINIYDYASRDLIGSMEVDRVPVKGDYIYLIEESSICKVEAVVFDESKNNVFVDLDQKF